MQTYRELLERLTEAEPAAPAAEPGAEPAAVEAKPAVDLATLTALWPDEPQKLVTAIKAKVAAKDGPIRADLAQVLSGAFMQIMKAVPPQVLKQYVQKAAAAK